MSSLPPLPTTVLAGFLGSGKTTLVNHALRHAGGRKILVLVNDFGDLPIDEDLIQSQDGATLTLANGCACCSMGGDLYQAFVAALDFTPRPDHLLIEASGVAEPIRIANFARAEPDLSLNGIVTLVDALNFSKSREDDRLSAILEEQVRSAHTLIVNKCDLVNQERLDQLKMDLSGLNSHALMITAEQGQVGGNILFGETLTAPLMQEDGSDHQHEAMFERWSVQIEGGLEPKNVRSIVSSLDRAVYRLKGLFREQDISGRLWSVQKVGDQTDVRLYQGQEISISGARFVAIASRGTDLPAILDPAFETLKPDQTRSVKSEILQVVAPS